MKRTVLNIKYSVTVMDSESAVFKIKHIYVYEHQDNIVKN